MIKLNLSRVLAPGCAALIIGAISCSADIAETDPQSPGSRRDLNRVLVEAGQIDGIRSLVVAQDGEILAERYYNGLGAHSVHDVRSASKSVLSILIGIAIERGFIESVDQTLADYLDPAAFELDDEWAAVTIENMLTMSAGHRWRELGGPSEYGEFVSALNQVEYILEKPVVDPPGSRFNYSEGSAHLLSVILTESTGMTAADFAAEYLFQPLGIGLRAWLADNQGYSFGGFGLRVSPYDMLAIGTLYLNEGRLGDQQIVPADWVRTSTRAHIATDNALPYGPGYGYLWWRGGTGAHDFYFATGYGGQFIINVPDLSLTVVATCNWGYQRDQGDRHWMEILSLIVDAVIPAIE